MGKPDKVLRSRPLKEVPDALAQLKRVVLFHPEPIVQGVKAKYCVCRQGVRKTGKKTKKMINCDDCWEWYHFDCVGLADNMEMDGVPWTCEWCQSPADKYGKHRWITNRKKAKLRHFKDTPKSNGIRPEGDAPPQFSAPPSWEAKVEEIQERARREAIRKKRLKEAVEKLVDEGGHHLVDAEGMAGLDVRAVDEAMVEDFIDRGLVNPDGMVDEGEDLSDDE